MLQYKWARAGRYVSQATQAFDFFWNASARQERAVVGAVIGVNGAIHINVTIESIVVHRENVIIQLVYVNLTICGYHDHH